MSEKRSWDIQPKRKAPPQAPQRVAAPEVRRAPQRVPQRIPQRAVVLKAKEKPMPQAQARAIKRQPAVPKGKDREPLRVRRKRQRRKSLIILSILFVLLVVAAFGSMWLHLFRIQDVNATGPDSQGMQGIADAQLAGTYHFVIPRNSIFFFPEEAIREQILQQYPDISAVSISRTSFSTISIVSIPREVALTWCGPTYPAVQLTASSTQVDNCYSADAQGIIFAPVSAAEASSSNTLRIYDPLQDDADTSAPLGKVIAQASFIPNALQFVKAIKSLGVPIVALVIRGDEADLYAQSGTRITYVLGQEEVTAQTAESAFPSLNLNDGSLEYVDLRFQGKAYFKRVGSTESNTASSTKSSSKST